MACSVISQETMFAAPPPSLNFGADDDFIDILAAMPDDLFNDDGSLSPLGFTAEHDDDDSLQNLNQAYSNLSLDDIINLDQACGDKQNCQTIDNFAFSPAELQQGPKTLPSLSSPMPDRQAEKKGQIGNEASQDGFPVMDALFEDQLFNTILCDDAEFQDFDDLLNCDLGLRLIDDVPQDQAAQSQVPKLTNANVSSPAQACEVAQAKQSEPTVQPQKRKPSKPGLKSRKRKSRKSRKRKSDTLPLGEKRKTKWRRGDNDMKMKRGVHQVRIYRRKIRVVAEEEGMNERALRRYVHISMDPRKQNSGYYIPLQPGEKVPKCLRAIIQTKF